MQVDCSNALMQRLELEKQSLSQHSVQREQDHALQLQWLQQHCQETVQQARLQHAEQVLMFIVVQNHQTVVTVVAHILFPCWCNAHALANLTANSHCCMTGLELQVGSRLCVRDLSLYYVPWEIVTGS